MEETARAKTLSLIARQVTSSTPGECSDGDIQCVISFPG